MHSATQVSCNSRSRVAAVGLPENLFLTMSGAVATALYALSHLPFIIIQRYNRPRLARLYLRLGGNRTVQQPAPCAEAAQPVGAA